MPTVTTTDVSGIAESSAGSGGIVTSDGGAATGTVTCGICWSTSPNPTTADSKTIDGTGSGAFSSYISGLAVNSTYYVRAYVTNNAGTAYGAEVSFTSVPFVCGNAFAINHLAGSVAPVTKLVTYGTVATPPSEVTIPPPLAVLSAIPDTSVVVTVGIVAGTSLRQRRENPLVDFALFCI